ncbi:amino acid transporter ANTL1-like isoform X2 [Elysia marginata]|uniref:Amino acid transporter ANTL1-like isoform X2 n=1 Tax=Elysia marginata TaxID=1093978 RepID=A0AAV4FSV0_9GAST|nr:amino acid transporter ANTL1-like isoform X2 [Elysia marginata]
MAELSETAGLIQNGKSNGVPGSPTHGLTVFTTAVFAVGEMAGSGVLALPRALVATAVGATIATSIACVIIIANIAVDSVDAVPAFYPNVDAKDFFMAFGTICFAFGGHPGFPTFQADMKQPEKFGKAIFLAYFILLLMYLPVAICGYSVYGINAEDNILLNLSAGPMQYIVEILITMHLFFGFVIVINPVCQEMEEVVGIPTHFTFKRIISRTVIMVVVLFIAESIPHFGAILSLIGGSTTTLLAYILPPVFYLKLCSMEGDWEQQTPSLATKVACVEIMLVGLVAGVASTYAAVDALATSSFSTPCYINFRKAAM